MSAVIVGLAEVLDLMVAAANVIAVTAPLVQTMQAEGRTMLTPEEWDTIINSDDSAIAGFAKAIAAAKAENK